MSKANIKFPALGRNASLIIEEDNRVRKDGTDAKTTLR
jgi:hypothetical protein